MGRMEEKERDESRVKMGRITGTGGRKEGRRRKENLLVEGMRQAKIERKR